MKNRMIVWAGTVILVVILLMAVIVAIEPEETEGISRAEASKALALALVSEEECVALLEAREDSFFGAQEGDFWAARYMDYLYEEGILDPSITEPTVEAALGEITYREILQVAGAISKDLKRETKAGFLNRGQAYPRETFWQFYEALAQALGEKTGVRTYSAALYGLEAEEIDGRVYTTEGTFRAYGFDLSPFMDRELFFWAREGEIVGLPCVAGSEVTYENIWIEPGKDGELTAWFASCTRTFKTEISLQEGSGVLADLSFTEGHLTGIRQKGERVNARVLSLTRDSAELEGLGVLPFAESFHIYRLYGETAVLEDRGILEEYENLTFVMDAGELLAALLTQEAHVQIIRVLIMDSGYKNPCHTSVRIGLTHDTDYSYTDAQGEVRDGSFGAGSILSFTCPDERLQNGGLTLMPRGDDGIEFLSITREQGTPVYSGTLELKETDDGIVAVNALSVEDYLKKVVPSEMPASYELEALKAQAICARTYAYRQIAENAYSAYGAHVDDSTAFQVYNNTPEYLKSTEAVVSTYGKILLYDGRPAEALYYSTSCGRGTDAALWGNDAEAYPYLRSKEILEGGRELSKEDNADFEAYITAPDREAWEADFPFFRWQTTVPAGQLAAEAGGEGSLIDVVVTQRGRGGIATELLIKRSVKNVRVRGQSAIRALLGNASLKIVKNDGSVSTGSTSLPSAYISIRKEEDEDGTLYFHISGGGYGHGVGMSQNGAQAMARAGKSCEEILAFFYEGASVGAP